MAAESAEYAAGCEHSWQLVSETARHLPGLEPGIRAIGRHVLEQPLADIGKCCTDGYDWE